MGKSVAPLLALVLLASSCAVAYSSVIASSPNTWTAKTPMNVARAYLGVAVVNGKIYAIGGDVGSEIGNCLTGTSMTYLVVNATEEYDPASDNVGF